MSRTIELDKHEVVVDRDWLDNIANLVANEGLWELSKEIHDVAYPEGEDSDAEEE